MDEKVQEQLDNLVPMLASFPDRVIKVQIGTPRADDRNLIFLSVEGTSVAGALIYEAISGTDEDRLEAVGRWLRERGCKTVVVRS